VQRDKKEEKKQLIDKTAIMVSDKTTIKGAEAMSCYKHLSIEERESILLMWAGGTNLSEMGWVLGRAKSTISRELNRNSSRAKPYSAAAAQNKYRRRRQKCRRIQRLRDQQTRNKVIELLQMYWSPEQISQRLKQESNEIQIGTSTIYRGVKAEILPREMKQKLRARPYHKPKGSRTGHLPISQSIKERPNEANQRLEIGHWESDTVRGSYNSGCIATHVDRKSRFLISIKIPNRTTQAYMDATIKAFLCMPEHKRKTFTTDHGKEFAEHRRLTEELGTKIYFADPGSPGQRGTNENTNGLLRQFFPKRSGFQKVTQADVDNACSFLNSRPRKCLGWLTPLEIFSSISLHLT
jgi:IS30 family transposase